VTNRDPAPVATPGRTEISPFEAATVVALCFGIAIWTSISAMNDGFTAPNFSDSGLEWTVLVELGLGSLALFFLHRRGYAVGSLYPSPTAVGTVVGIALYVATFGLDLLIASLLPSASAGGDQPVARMIHEAHLSLQVVVGMALVNGTFEEVFLLGVVMRGLLPRFGIGTAFATMLLVRVLYHLYQGPAGAVMVLGTGALFGLFYLRTGRLWPVVFAHVLWDIVPFVAAGVTSSS
jgi:membrane protease YdiL (CAAX protease family)